MSEIPAGFLNVDLDLKTIADPGPLLSELGSRVSSQRIGKVGRAHWVRLMLSRQPASPSSAITAFAKLLARVSAESRATWNDALSREFDIGIQAGLESAAGEWVLESKVVQVAAKLAAQLRITIYPPDLATNSLQVKPLPTTKRSANRRTAGRVRSNRRGPAT